MKTILKDGIKEIKNDIKAGNIKKQIANILTSLRFLSPFVLIPLMYYDKKIEFIIMVILFSLTDTFDGYFARKYNATSKIGAYLDAVVDKIFALSLLIPIVINSTLDQLNYYSVFLIIGFEVIIGILNLYAFLKNLDPTSTKYGKVKTCFLFTLLGLFYLDKFISLNFNFLFIFTIITILFQILTVISYYFQIKKRKNIFNSSL